MQRHQHTSGNTKTAQIISIYKTITKVSKKKLAEVPAQLTLCGRA